LQTLQDDDDDEEETAEDDDEEDESEDDDDDDKEDNFKDEAGLISGEAPVDRSASEDDNKKKRLIGGGVCCILLLAIALGLGLGLGLKDDDPDPTSAPFPVPAPNLIVTAPPTTSNVSTPSASSAPSGLDETPQVAEEVTVAASADTTIYVDGELVGDDFSKEETMLVQGGEAGNNELPTAYSLVQFELNRTELEMLMDPVDVEFCLDHVETAEDVDRVVTYTACLVPYTSSVNNLTGSNANYTLPDDCIGGEKVTFDISPPDQDFCIPATDVVMAAANEATMIRRLRGHSQERRKLLMLDDILVLAISNPNASDQPGDRFYTSKDANGRVPLVEFTSSSNNTGTDVPTGTLDPNVTEVPEPNVTEVPEFNATELPEPEYEPEYEPCSVCGENMTATILDAEIPGASGDVSSCGDVEFVCAEGYCDPEQCKALPSIVFNVCGCVADSTDIEI
jgi:hypothetical protein